MLALLPTFIDVAGCVHYDGGEYPSADILDQVDFYVPPYMGPGRDLDLIPHLPALAVLQTLTAGVDHVLARVPAGVLLCNAAGVHDASTAELAVGLLLASLRGLDVAARDQLTGSWRPQRRTALADLRVVVVGFGGVGRAIARRLAPFEVEVVAVARTARAGVVPMAELAIVLPEADAVLLAVPLTAQTRGLVDAEFLARMKNGAVLVNVARGPVVDTDALLVELMTGRLTAALDVTDPEPLAPEHPLWRAPGVLISPHVGGNTTAFQPRGRALVIEQLRRFRAGEPLANVIG